MKKILILGFVVIGVLAGSLTGTMYAIAQSADTNKVFRKDFCLTENNILDDINYPTGEQLSYSTSGCPESQKIISKWNQLSVPSKTLITSRLTANGYIEGEEVNAITGVIIK